MDRWATFGLLVCLCDVGCFVCLWLIAGNAWIVVIAWFRVSFFVVVLFDSFVLSCFSRLMLLLLFVTCSCFWPSCYLSFCSSGTTIYSNLFVCVSLIVIFLASSNFLRLSLSIFLSIVLYAIILFGYSLFPDWFPDAYGVMEQLVASPAFWLNLLLTPSLCFAPLLLTRWICVTIGNFISPT